MANSTVKNLDKIKLIDQMLEDMAGDEFDEFDETQSNFESNISRLSADDDLFEIDNLH